LRRIFLRFCDGWMSTTIPFPFRKLDEILGPRPDVKLIVGWAHADGAGKLLGNEFIDDFRRRLRNLEQDGRIGVLYESGPKCKSQYLPPLLSSHVSPSCNSATIYRTR
jgi:hypothetical protein